MGMTEEKVMVRHEWVMGQEAWQAIAKAHLELVDQSQQQEGFWLIFG